MIPQPRRHITNPSSSIFFQQSRPRLSKAVIIDGKHPTKLLPLHGTHFIRKDPFDLSSDDEDPTTDTARHDPSGASPAEGHSSSDDSPLSDAESVLSIGKTKAATARRTKTQDSDAPFAGEKQRAFDGRRDSRASDLHDAASIAKTSLLAKLLAVKKTAASVTTDLAKRTQHAAQDPSPNSKDRTTAGRHSVRKAMKDDDRAVEKKKKAPLRRLPVNELVLVVSSMLAESDENPVPVEPAPEAQDPINDQSSMTRHDQTQAFNNNIDKPEAKAALSTIRKRLKTPQRKPTIAKRKRPAWMEVPCNERVQRGGDKFEVSETRVTYSVKGRTTRRQTHRQAASMFRSAMLQLRSGPLPSVVFEPETLEPGSGDPPATRRVLPAPSIGLSRRMVSFGGRDEGIMAQLSSISAPEREDSEDDAEAEEGDDDDHEVIGFTEHEEDSDCGPQDAHMAGYSDDDDLEGNDDMEMLPYDGHARHNVLSNHQLEDSRSLSQRHDGGIALDSWKTDPLSAVSAHTRTYSSMKPHTSIVGSTPSVPSAGTAPNSTASNTHHHASIGDAAESRFFSRARSIQPQQQQQQLQHGTVSRRQYSRYFLDSDLGVQVCRSERVVPETSSALRGNMSLSHLAP